MGIVTAKNIFWHFHKIFVLERTLQMPFLLCQNVIRITCKKIAIKILFFLLKTKILTAIFLQVILMTANSRKIPTNIQDYQIKESQYEQNI